MRVVVRPGALLSLGDHRHSARFFFLKEMSSTKRLPESNTALPHEKDGSKDLGDEAFRRSLNKEKFDILRRKHTERGGTGIYDDFFEKGSYLCAACGTTLYTSEMKFHSGCGWPAFSDCLPKSVREEADPIDGHRVEILCNACNGHLGHVFRGERFGTVNERHCVNSASISFLSDTK